MTSMLTIRDTGDELPDMDEALHRASDVPGAMSLPVRRHAAVLMPLLFDGSEWRLLFIRRAINERDRHSGQVAFPGGARDPGDRDAIHTALREAHEEIGLGESRARVLGTLGAYVTISRYQVVPVVAMIDGDHSLVLQRSEVARAFTVPLAWLADRANVQLHTRHGMDPEQARRHPIIVYTPYDGETLWGASARMTLNLLRAIEDGTIVLPVPTAGPANRPDPGSEL